MIKLQANNWEKIIKAFLEPRSDRRGTTPRDLKKRMRRVLVRPKHVHYALAPAQVQHLISLQSKGGKDSQTIDITSVDKAPDTIPEGKEALLEGKAVENSQTSLLATGQD